MDALTLAQTTVLYALSTIAQVCAALVAFIGALGLYRLQSLYTERERRIQDLRFFLTQYGMSPTVVSLLSDDFVITLARKREYEPTPSVEQEALTSTLKFIEAFKPVTLRVRRWLFIFCGSQILVIFLAICSFQFVDSLSHHPWGFRIFLLVTVAVIVVSTVRMLIEIVGPATGVPRWWDLRTLLPWRRRRSEK